jgi:hypothetical protein
MLAPFPIFRVYQVGHVLSVTNEQTLQRLEGVALLKTDD